MMRCEAKPQHGERKLTAQKAGMTDVRLATSAALSPSLKHGRGLEQPREASRAKRTVVSGLALHAAHESEQSMSLGAARALQHR